MTLGFSSIILETVLLAIGSLGGLSVYIWWITNLASKHYFNKRIEDHNNKLNQTFEIHKNKLNQILEEHKMKLKKSEFLFQREFDATSELISIIEEISPSQNFPHMNWNDACLQMAHEFEETGMKLRKYIAKHGAALDDKAEQMLNQSIGLAAGGKFEIDNGHVSPVAKNSVNDFPNQKSHQFATSAITALRWF